MDMKSLTLVRLCRPESFLGIISKSIFDKARLIELQKLYLAFSREVSIKKKSFKLKTLKFFIVYSLLLQGLTFQVSASKLSYYCFIKFLYLVLTYSFNCVIFKIHFESNQLTKILIQPISVKQD